MPLRDLKGWLTIARIRELLCLLIKNQSSSINKSKINEIMFKRSKNILKVLTGTNKSMEIERRKIENLYVGIYHDSTLQS